MNAEQYRAVIGWFNARPTAKKALRLVSRSAVALVYLLYLGVGAPKIRCMGVFAGRDGV